MHARRGLILIEVVAALAILAIVGSALFAVAAESLARVDNARRHDHEMAAANNLMSAVSLWTPEDFDRRLGQRRQGQWLLEIGRESPRLYTAVIRDTLTGAPVLATAFYRGP